MPKWSPSLSSIRWEQSPLYLQSRIAVACEGKSTSYEIFILVPFLPKSHIWNLAEDLPSKNFPTCMNIRCSLWPPTQSCPNSRPFPRTERFESGPWTLWSSCTSLMRQVSHRSFLCRPVTAFLTCLNLRVALRDLFAAMQGLCSQPLLASFLLEKVCIMFVSLRTLLGCEELVNLPAEFAQAISRT